MLEIAQLLESALASNRTGLRKAAMRSISRMSPQTTLRDLLDTEPGEAIRELTLDEFGQALAPLVYASGGGRRIVGSKESAQSREERMYLTILEALAAGPKTIGQLGKAIAIETAELRGYLSWMKRMSKVVTTGKARATRYALP